MVSASAVRLSLARMLIKDLQTEAIRPGFIGNFNCARADGSPIVRSCSVEVWRHNIEASLAEAVDAPGYDEVLAEWEAWSLFENCILDSKGFAVNPQTKIEPTRY
jgi:hypothetical protein